MSVPVISLADEESLPAAIDEALTSVGFFAIVDHGVDRSIIDAAWDRATAFFDLPDASKRKWISDDPGHPYGYEPLLSEALGSAHGDASAADLKETFNIGPPPRPGLVTGDDFRVARRIWPDEPAGFEEAWTRYYDAMEGLASRLMHTFAIALGLDAAFFDDKIDRHLSAMRALNYPPQAVPPAPGQIRAGTHTDYGTLTILRPGPGTGGLQARDVGGSWVTVPIVDDGFVINIGDLMAMWTNDRWRSTPHRVVNPDDPVAATERRQSIAFFHQPNWDAPIEALPTCVSDTNPARHEPTTSGRWLQARVAAAVSRSARH